MLNQPSAARRNSMNQKIRYQQHQQPQPAKFSATVGTVTSNQNISREARAKLNCMKSFMNDPIFFVEPYYQTPALPLQGQIAQQTSSPIVSPGQAHSFLDRPGLTVQHHGYMQLQTGTARLAAPDMYARYHYLDQQAQQAPYTQRHYQQMRAKSQLQGQSNRSW
ncbi:AaceriACR276Cp [[Ashbya] aceris (nom. inval.)]|nr:AaceriACR276Cp [[Ashbya] aceris (nom. inval.)]